MAHLLKTLIEDDFGIQGRGRWYHSIKHDSLVYDEQRDEFFWNSEDIRGDVYTYLTKVRGMNNEQARNFLKNSFGGFSKNNQRPPEPHPYEKLVDIFWSNNINNKEYWYKRCLTDYTIDNRRLGYYDGWNCIPMHEDGRFANFQMRRDFPEKKIVQYYRHGKPILYNAEILPFTNTIYIVEGTVDCILLNQEGLPAISPNGANIWQPEWYNKFEDIVNIYFIADNDKAGEGAAKLVAKSLGTERVKIYRFDGEEEHFDTVNYFQIFGSI